MRSKVLPSFPKFEAQFHRILPVIFQAQVCYPQNSKLSLPLTVFIFPSFLKDVSARHETRCWQLLSLSTWRRLCYFLLAPKLPDDCCHLMPPSKECVISPRLRQLSFLFSVQKFNYDVTCHGFLRMQPIKISLKLPDFWADWDIAAESGMLSCVTRTLPHLPLAVSSCWSTDPTRPHSSFLAFLSQLFRRVKILNCPPVHWCNPLSFLLY